MGSLGNTFRSHSDNPCCNPKSQNCIPCQNVILFSIWPPTQELQRMSASHRLVGFPLHFAYSDTEAIAEGVRGTGVHLCRYSHLFSFDKCHIPFSCREPGVEFALAVQVIWDKLIFDWVRLTVLCSGGAISRHCHVSLGLCCLSCSTEIDPRACDWRVGSYQFTCSYLPWLHSLRTFFRRSSFAVVSLSLSFVIHSSPSTHLFKEKLSTNNQCHQKIKYSHKNNKSYNNFGNHSSC